MIPYKGYGINCALMPLSSGTGEKSWELRIDIFDNQGNRIKCLTIDNIAGSREEVFKIGLAEGMKMID